MKWHDGKPLTAEDVRFTYEKILDPKIGSRMTIYFQAVKEVQATGPHTVVFRLKEPDPTFLPNMWTGILPKHLWEKKTSPRASTTSWPSGRGRGRSRSGSAGTT